MRTSYAVGDRCRVWQAEGAVTKVMPERHAYRVKLDDGRSMAVDEKRMRPPTPPAPVHKMVEGPLPRRPRPTRR